MAVLVRRFSCANAPPGRRRADPHHARSRAGANPASPLDMTLPAWSMAPLPRFSERNFSLPHVASADRLAAARPGVPEVLARLGRSLAPERDQSSVIGLAAPLVR
jgi:hypothetical protein